MEARTHSRSRGSRAQQDIGDAPPFSLARQVGRYSLASFSFAFAAYLIFIVVIQIHELNPTLAILLSQLCVLPFAFAWSRKRVFRSYRSTARALIMYSLGYFASMIFQWLNMLAFHSSLQFSPFAVAAWGIVVSFPLFFLYQKLIFSRPERKKEKGPGGAERQLQMLTSDFSLLKPNPMPPAVTPWWNRLRDYRQ